MALLSPAARQGTGPLARLMREGGLYCVFQPWPTCARARCTRTKR
jgi:hypothetical protein